MACSASDNASASRPRLFINQAGGFDDPAAVFGDLVNKLLPVGLPSRQGGAVVAAHEQGIAHHIS
jgi:hypothetical protein